MTGRFCEPSTQTNDEDAALPPYFAHPVDQVALTPLPPYLVHPVEQVTGYGLDAMNLVIAHLQSHVSRSAYEQQGSSSSSCPEERRARDFNGSTDIIGQGRECTDPKVEKVTRTWIVLLCL